MAKKWLRGIGGDASAMERTGGLQGEGESYGWRGEEWKGSGKLQMSSDKARTGYI